jgi:hypothetical protein
MAVALDTLVMLPGYAPYPRYGRVAKLLDTGTVLVSQVQCGDPRCEAEHAHGDVVWSVDALEAVTAYQPRATWERGRKSSPNAPVAGA